MGADGIRSELESARVEARRLAAEQQAWREHVFGLFERARDAGLSLDEIVEALGLSGKWAEHMKRRLPRATMRIEDARFFFGGPGF